MIWNSELWGEAREEYFYFNKPLFYAMQLFRIVNKKLLQIDIVDQTFEDIKFCC